MSYISWHNYGYGICTDDITERSIERLKNLLALAPEFNAQMQNGWQIQKLRTLSGTIIWASIRTAVWNLLRC